MNTFVANNPALANKISLSSFPLFADIIHCERRNKNVKVQVYSGIAAPFVEVCLNHDCLTCLGCTRYHRR